MANFIKHLTALVLILSSLIAQSEEGYPCYPSKIVYRASDLDRTVEHVKRSFYPRGNSLAYATMREELVKANGQATYRGVPASELLEMENNSEDKCNLAELDKRLYYSEFLPHAETFIMHLLDGLRKFCRQRDEIRQEAVAATNDDRSIIQDVISIGKLANKTEQALTSVHVRKATEKYVKKQRGKEEFVRDARRLHILAACEHMAYVKLLVWGDQYPYNGPFYTGEKLLDDPKICQIYRKDYGKQVQGLTIGSKLKRIVITGPKKVKNWRDDVDKSLRQGQETNPWHNFLPRFLFFLANVAVTTPYHIARAGLGIGYLLSYKLPVFLYDLTKRDINDKKYKIYSI